MKKNTLYLVISMVITIFLSGCGSKILIPYDENALCNAGKGGGYCGSVSEVYKVTRYKKIGEYNE